MDVDLCGSRQSTGWAKSKTAFTMGEEIELNSASTWLALFDWTDALVVPTEVLSPESLVALEGILYPYSGVVLQETAKPVSILSHAAHHCCFQLGVAVLRRLVVDRGSLLFLAPSLNWWLR